MVQAVILHGCDIYNTHRYSKVMPYRFCGCHGIGNPCPPTPHPGFVQLESNNIRLTNIKAESCGVITFEGAKQSFFSSFLLSRFGLQKPKQEQLLQECKLQNEFLDNSSH